MWCWKTKEGDLIGFASGEAHGGDELVAYQNAQDMDPYAQTFTEDVVWEGDHLPAPVLGRAGAAQAMGMYIAAFPDLRFEEPEAAALYSLLTSQKGAP